MGEMVSGYNPNLSPKEDSAPKDDPKTELVEDPSKAYAMAEAEKPFRDEAHKDKNELENHLAAKPKRPFLDRITHPIGAVGPKHMQEMKDWRDETARLESEIKRNEEVAVATGESAGEAYDSPDTVGLTAGPPERVLYSKSLPPERVSESKSLPPQRVAERLPEEKE